MSPTPHHWASASSHSALAARQHRSLMPRRALAAGCGAVGVPAAVGWLHPLLGQALAMIEVAIIVSVLTSALFGSSVISERAFRLLRWSANRPEPPAPTPPQNSQPDDTPLPLAISYHCTPAPVQAESDPAGCGTHRFPDR